MVHVYELVGYPTRDGSTFVEDCHTEPGWICPGEYLRNTCRREPEHGDVEGQHKWACARITMAVMESVESIGNRTMLDCEDEDPAIDEALDDVVRLWEEAREGWQKYNQARRRQKIEKRNEFRIGFIKEGDPITVEDGETPRRYVFSGFVTDESEDDEVVG